MSYERLREQKSIQNACRNFTKFITSVQSWTEMNCLDFEANSKVKVTARTHTVKIGVEDHSSFNNMNTDSA